MATLPLAPVPVTRLGAETAVGNTAMLLRTEAPPPLQVRDPNRHVSFTGAFTLVIVTLNVPVAPGASVSWAGVTWTVRPGGACVLAVKVVLWPSTLVTLRCTVATPARASTPMVG